MSKRRQKRAQLRALECLAYSSTLSSLRAQNDLDKEAKSIIDDLRPLLHISSHRHLAELRRIINDEELEYLVSVKHIGESNLKHKWMEFEEKEYEDQKPINSSSPTKKKSKTS